MSPYFGSELLAVCLLLNYIAFWSFFFLLCKLWVMMCCYLLGSLNGCIRQLSCLQQYVPQRAYSTEALKVPFVASYLYTKERNQKYILILRYLLACPNVQGIKKGGAEICWMCRRGCKVGRRLWLISLLSRSGKGSSWHADCVGAT